MMTEVSLTRSFPGAKPARMGNDISIFLPLIYNICYLLISIFKMTSLHLN